MAGAAEARNSFRSVTTDLAAVCDIRLRPKLLRAAGQRLHPDRFDLGRAGEPVRMLRYRGGLLRIRWAIRLITRPDTMRRPCAMGIVAWLRARVRSFRPAPCCRRQSRLYLYADCRMLQTRIHCAGLRGGVACL